VAFFDDVECGVEEPQGVAIIGGAHLWAGWFEETMPCAINCVEEFPLGSYTAATYAGRPIVFNG
jgi:hypothetical protein